MIKNNYHTHTAYCHHAVGNVEDYVVAAIRYGFEELGMSDHAPILENFMTKSEYDKNWCYQNMKSDIVPIYLNEIEQARWKYGRQIHIYSGFETEFLPEQIEFYRELKSKVDYLNLGIHYFRYKGKILNSFSEVNYNTLNGYVETAIMGMKTGLFTTFVHPDLFMFQYQNVFGKREFDSYCIEATKRICETAIECGVYLEVNANGLRNSVVYGDSEEWLYPYRDFWNIAKEYKELKIIIGADAHNPLHLANEDVEMICRFCEELGLNIEDRMEVKSV